MLARNFLPATDLGITQAQHAALIMTLHAMESGRVVHLRNVKEIETDYEADERLYLGHFNMNYWKDNADCGTVACIGGTAEILGKIQFNDDGLPRNLAQLFYPGTTDNYNDITVEQAAAALRHYLIFGTPNWEGVLDDQD